MRRPPEEPLPPPTDRPVDVTPLPDAAALRALALSRRPDLLALAHRIDADRAALALACAESKPDFEVMAAYDAFWQRPEQDLRPMIGLKLNLPVRHARRQGAITEAQAKLAQRQAELAKMSDQAAFEVHQALEQVRESEQAVRLYVDNILPAATANVQAAQSEYVTGRVSFLNLVEAQRNMVMLRDRSFEAAAELTRRRAMLERAAGGPFRIH
jgi:outer membrane protein TolC